MWSETSISKTMVYFDKIHNELDSHWVVEIFSLFLGGHTMGNDLNVLELSK